MLHSINVYICLSKNIIMYKIVIILLIALCINNKLFSQDYPTSLWLESLEEFAIEQQEDIDWEEELQELSYYLDHPLNLNSATKEELEQFPFLTNQQIENIRAYIIIHGPMKTIYELQLVEGLDKKTIELLKHFVCAQNIEGQKYFPSIRKILSYGEHDFLTRLDQPLYTRKGYKTAYLGPKQYHSFRYQYKYSSYFQVGISGEKDAGEPLFALHNKQGYDHYSYYIQLKHLGRIENFTIGTYRLNYGQGLVLGSSYLTGKGYSMMSTTYRKTDIRKYGSSDEDNYFRGIATRIKILPELKMSAFYSHRNMDGVIKEEKITSIYKTGLHRTAKEADKINQFTMQMAGTNIVFAKKQLQLGLTGIYYFFNKPYAPSLSNYAKFNLKGNHFYNIGLDYQYRIGHFSLMGEAAKGKKGFATINKFSYRFNSDYQVMLLHRYYAEDYWAYYAKSFGESSSPQNENGWYLAAEASPFTSFRFFASIDMFSFPWWKYRISKSSQGIDAMCQATYQPHSEISMSCSYRIKRKERDVTGTSGEEIYPTRHHKLRYRLNYQSKSWHLRTTLEYNRFVQDHVGISQGFLGTQMVSYSLLNNSLQFCAQGSYFNTDDYDSRIYAYEKGMLNSFYTPSFYGEGFRYSLHTRYDLNKHFMFILNFGHTIYLDRNNISSGNDLIESNKKADIQMQLRIRF